MSEVGNDEQHIEASTAQVSEFETDGLRAVFYVAEYVAKTMDWSNFESELHRKTEALVLEASTVTVRRLLRVLNSSEIGRTVGRKRMVSWR
jgi:hypothetical protein